MLHVTSTRSIFKGLRYSCFVARNVQDSLGEFPLQVHSGGTEATVEIAVWDARTLCLRSSGNMCDGKGHFPERNQR